MPERNAVEIRELRDQISAALKALIVLGDAQYIITATWAAHTHMGEIDGQPPMSFPQLCEHLVLDETLHRNAEIHCQPSGQTWLLARLSIITAD
jgi:hypothetical protein